MDASKGVILAKCMRFLRTCKQPNTTEEERKEIRELEIILLQKYATDEKSAQNKAPSTSHSEHEIVRKSLLQIGVKKGIETGYFQEEQKVGHLFRADFYVPEARLIIEINGVQHFYPYTRRPNQYTQFKTKLLRGN